MKIRISSILVHLAIWMSLTSHIMAANDVDTRMKIVKKSLQVLARQIMLQQFALEDRTRTDGASGIKQARTDQQGTSAYHATSFTGATLASMHDHPQINRRVGLGGVVAVLNGIEFGKGHNDYNIAKPKKAPNAKNPMPLYATDNIDYPNVPSDVKGSVDDQIAKMKDYFKKFKNNDLNIAGNKNIFKPVLCYLEGAWIKADTDNIPEEIRSNHGIKTTSWKNLEDQVLFAGGSGRSSDKENQVNLPTSIMELKDGKPVFAKFDYHIACHEIDVNFPPNRLWLIDDLQSRMTYNRTLEAHQNSKNARFKVVTRNRDYNQEESLRFNLLDILMGDIPGYNGYGNVLNDMGVDNIKADQVKSEPYAKKPFNAGNYHRWFKAKEFEHRGFKDENIFMAINTQSKVAPFTLNTECNNAGVCKKRFEQKWSYAIPLEIIYLTPLSKWNPYNIAHQANGAPAGSDVGKSSGKPLTYSSDSAYYHTPAKLFNSPSEGAMWVKGNTGAVQCKPSGVSTFVDIKDVGQVRLRYPIMPVHQEGSVVWKEIETLKDMIMDPVKFNKMYLGDKYPWGQSKP